MNVLPRFNVDTASRLSAISARLAAARALGVAVAGDGDTAWLIERVATVEAERDTLADRVEVLEEEAAPDDWDATPCEVCGHGCLYGSRHLQCSAAVEAEGGALRERVATLTAALTEIRACAWIPSCGACIRNQRTIDAALGTGAADGAAGGGAP